MLTTLLFIAIATIGTLAGLCIGFYLGYDGSHGLCVALQELSLGGCA